MYTSVISRNDINELLSWGWTEEEVKKYDEYLVRFNRVKRRGRSAYKDSEKTKVYTAENKFLCDYTKVGGVNKNFKDYDEALRAMNNILVSKTWSKFSKNRRIELVQKRDMGMRSRTAGLATWGQITLCPTSGFNMYVLLHELAHVAGHMHHDLSFRQTLVKLVSRFMSAKAGDILKKTFRSSGLRMHRKTTTMTAQQWVRTYRRMAAVRTKIAA
jgi:acyl carrier protein phosphodiesterase